MATTQQLAIRTLQKIKVLDGEETASAADLAKALEKIEAVHAEVAVQGLVRWTLLDIPKAAEEAYVLMAADLLADDFSAVKDPNWIGTGLRMFQRIAHTPIIDESHAEYF